MFENQLTIPKKTKVWRSTTTALNVCVCVCVCVCVRERESKKDNSRSLLMTATSTDSKLFVQTHFSPLLLPFLEQKHHFLLPCLGRYIDAGSRYIMDD